MIAAILLALLIPRKTASKGKLLLEVSEEVLIGTHKNYILKDFDFFSF